jgi:transcription antitermination factor NusG
VYKRQQPKFSRLQVNRRTGEKKVKRRPLMPGYIFVRFPAGYYNDLADCSAVRSILKNADGFPAKVRGEVIGRILRAERRLANDAQDARIYREGLRRGAPSTFDQAMAQALFDGTGWAQVVSGMFVGRVLEIVSITPRGLLEVAVTLAGRQTTAFLKPLIEAIPVESRSDALAKSALAA